MDETLSSDERARIRADELFRREIRESLETPRSRWWGFLNSAFGLWLLGSVSVGLLTWSVGTIRDQQRERAAVQTLNRHLRTEIAARIGAATYVLRATEFHEPRPEVDDYAETSDILNGRAGHATYPELADRKLSGLVIQLRDSDSCRTADLQGAIGRAELFEADFNKWRRRSITPSELGASDYSTARKNLDKKFVGELAMIEAQVRRACE